MEHQFVNWLQKSSEGFLRVFNSLSEGVIVADDQGHFLFFNTMAEQILGLGMQSVDSDKWSEVYGCFYPDGVTPFPSENLPLAKTIRTGHNYSETVYIKNPAKSEGRFIDISSSPLFDDDQKIIGGVVIFKDITSRHLAGIELTKLTNAVSQTADAVMITDLHGIIEYVNPAFEGITGFKHNEVIGKTPRILKSGQYDGSFYQQLWDSIVSGHPYKAEMINKKKNGDFIWIQNTITPIKDTGKRITHFVAVMKDITEMKQRKEQEMRLLIAREIQQRLMRSETFIPGFAIAGKNFPAEETGGDYFDVISTEDDGLWLTIADVSSHGIGSALLMAGTRAYLRAFIENTRDPGEVLYKMNNALLHDLNEVQFVTMLLVYVNTKNRYVTYSGAGHVPGFLIDKAGKIRQILESTGIPLGYQKDVTYKNRYLPHIEEGDLFIFSTDGIMEAQNDQEVEFGFEKILSIAHQYRHESASDIIDQIYREVCSFTQKDYYEDDVTLSVCKVGAVSEDLRLMSNELSDK